MTFEAIKIAERTPDGKITPVILGTDCDICDGLYQKGIYITHVVKFSIVRGGKKQEIEICKSCLCEAVKAIDKAILED